MDKKVSFHYFYGSQADQYSFYRIPKALFQDEYFRGLSSDAKILYGLMLDRMSLSIKNQWFDEKNRAYIYFSIEDIMELLNCGRNKAIKSMQELDEENGIGLIEKKRQGFGKTNIIYVKSFMLEEAKQESELSDTEKFINQTNEEKGTDTEVYKTNFKKSQKQTSRSPENKLQEVYISNPNYNNSSYNNISDNESYPIQSEENRFDNDNKAYIQAYEELVKENMSFLTSSCMICVGFGLTSALLCIKIFFFPFSCTDSQPPNLSQYVLLISHVSTISMHPFSILLNSQFSF